MLFAFFFTRYAVVKAFFSGIEEIKRYQVNVVFIGEELSKYDSTELFSFS